MYCDWRGNGQKPTRTKPPGQKPPRTIEIEFVQGTFVRDFCTMATKNGGSEMCDVLSGVPGCVTKCDRGGGQNWPKIAWRTLWTAPNWCWPCWKNIIMNECAYSIPPPIHQFINPHTHNNIPFHSSIQLNISRPHIHSYIHSYVHARMAYVHKCNTNMYT